MDGFEGLQIINLCLCVLEKAQEELKVGPMVDEDAVVQVVLDLAGSFLQDLPVLVDQPLDSNAIELCVVYLLSDYALVLEELQKLLPCQLVFVLAVELLHYALYREAVFLTLRRV